MKKIALVLSAFAVLAFSGVVRAGEEAPAGEKAPAKKAKKEKAEKPAAEKTEKTEKKTETK